MEDVTKATDGCLTPAARQENSEAIGPQFCAANISENYLGYAVDVMNYASKMQFMKIAEGVFTSKNKYAQFNVNNTSGATRQVRIGGFIALTGGYQNYNVAAGAADFAGVVDQYGANIKKIQGFSQFAIGKPMIISQIRVISNSATQLAEQFSYNTINPDGTITPNPINIAATEAKSDQRTNLVVVYGTYIISTNKYLEYPSLDLAANAFSLILEVSGVQNAADYVQL